MIILDRLIQDLGRHDKNRRKLHIIKSLLNNGILNWFRDLFYLIKNGII